MNEWIKTIKNKEIIDNLSVDEEVLADFRFNRYCPIFQNNIEAMFKPNNIDQLLEILKIALKSKISLVPFSSVYDFHGSTTCVEGGLLVDLRNLNVIEKIRASPLEGMSADIQPGVTFRQLNDALRPHDKRVVLPLRLPADTSVLSCYYGRNPLLESNKYEQHQDWRILTYQMAVAKKRGMLVGMGSEGLESGGDPGDYPYTSRLDLGRMLLGAIGAFGIVTRITPKLKFSLDKLEFLYAEGDKLSDLTAKVRKTIMATDAAEVAMICSPRAIAGYLSSIKNEYEGFLNKLPNWVAILAIGGEEELVDVEKADLNEFGAKNGLKLGNEPVLGMSNLLEREFRMPENVSKSFDLAPHLRIEFYTTANRLEKIENQMNQFFKTQGIDNDKIGFLANSIEMGRTFACEYQLYHEPVKYNDPKNLPTLGKLNLRDLYEACYKKIIEVGGVINLPRNTITAKLLYPMNPNYYELLRVLKYSIDPKNIMHPQAIFSGEGGLDPKTIQIAKVI